MSTGSIEPVPEQTEKNAMNWINFTNYARPVRDDKVFDACGISALINVNGKVESGARVVDMITCLEDRENGLGAGFAVYGCFPDRKDQYCFQVILEDEATRDAVKAFLQARGTVVHDERILVNEAMALTANPPVLWRFFYRPPAAIPQAEHDDHVMQLHMAINTGFNRRSFVMSSGKNMAVFKGNGWSYEIADYYKVPSYTGAMWLAHSRFPTNTPGSWFGAHPFSLLSWSVVHNGEITSYGTNKRYLEMFGYKCELLTDTEVLAYLFDLLVRRHGIPPQLVALAFNPPLYDDIARMPPEHQLVMKNIRMAYRSALVNGPFSIVVGSEINGKTTMIGLTDRKKLRPQLIGVSEDEQTYFISSEEASFKRLELAGTASINKVWAPHAGTPFIARVGDGLVRAGTEKPFEGLKVSINEHPPMVNA